MTLNSNAWALIITLGASNAAGNIASAEDFHGYPSLVDLIANLPMLSLGRDARQATLLNPEVPADGQLDAQFDEHARLTKVVYQILTRKVVMNTQYLPDTAVTTENNKITSFIRRVEHCEVDLTPYRQLKHKAPTAISTLPAVPAGANKALLVFGDQVTCFSKQGTLVTGKWLSHSSATGSMRYRWSWSYDSTGKRQTVLTTHAVPSLQLRKIVDYYDNDLLMTVELGSKTPPATIQFEYEYDAQQRWVKRYVVTQNARRLSKQRLISTNAEN